jgi:hypothetical protein
MICQDLGVDITALLESFLPLELRILGPFRRHFI